MPPEPRSSLRNFVELCIRRGQNAFQRALDQCQQLDQVVPDTHYIEQQLQHVLDAIRAAATELHNQAAIPIPSPARADPPSLN